MASLVNKAKDMLGNNNDDTSHEQTSHNAYAGTETLPEAVKTGPVHNNEALNKIDPRVHEHKGTTT